MKIQTSLFPNIDYHENLIRTTGILPSQLIQKLIDNGRIQASKPIENSQIQPASLDLRLGSVAYHVRASFLPGEYSSIMDKIERLDLKISEVDISHSNILKKDCVYIIPLLEQLDLPNNITAKANPRSTTGRLDIFVRLLTDYGTSFEGVSSGYKGKLYAEVIPRTFDIRISEGSILNQIRFSKGNPIPSDSKIYELDYKETLVYSENDNPLQANIDGGLKLSINLANSSSDKIIGYKAKDDAPIIDFNKKYYYNPDDFWEPIYVSKKTKGIILQPNNLHILISKEKVRVPSHYAAEMIPYEPTMGEFRVHYAGFFDPGFGYGQNDISGTPAVLEVRAHESPFFIEDGQTVAALQYYPLLEPSKKIYGVKIGSSYQYQKLALSKQFIKNRKI